MISYLGIWSGNENIWHENENVFFCLDSYFISFQHVRHLWNREEVVAFCAQMRQEREFKGKKLDSKMWTIAWCSLCVYRFCYVPNVSILWRILRYGTNRVTKCLYGADSILAWVHLFRFYVKKKVTFDWMDSLWDE